MRHRLIHVVAPAAAVVFLGAAGCGGSSHDAARARVAGAASAQQADVTLPGPAVERLHLDPSRVERRGTFRLKTGKQRSVYLAPTTTGTTCVLDDGDGGVGAGCSRAPFAEHPLTLVEASNGGPEPETMSDLHLAGVAAPRVATLRVELTNGALIEVPLTSQNAFLYEASVADLHAGVTPQAVHALDAAGKTIDVFAVGGKRAAPATAP